MRKRWIGWALWFLTAGCLYFFENNTGTRIVLICSMLLPLLPPLRQLFFTEDSAHSERPEKAEASMTVQTLTVRETTDPGEVRTYRLGDPVRRIHWKLSIRTRDILVREAEQEQEEIPAERTVSLPHWRGKGNHRKRLAGWLGAGVLFCFALLFLIPEARAGLLALINRLFAASESVNAYEYTYFHVPEGQPVWLAAGILGWIALLITAEALLLRSRLIPLAAAIVCALFQVYYGLSFRPWIHVALLMILAIWLMKRPITRGGILRCGTVICATAALIAVLIPGTDPATEDASERIRDLLGRYAGEAGGTTEVLSGEERETRHTNTRSLEVGIEEARTDREYRLVTVEEEEISMPHRVDYLKIILGLIGTAAAVIIPFAPFAVLNARRRKALDARKAFRAEKVSEAVTAIFRHVILWLETTRHDGGNRLYREWTNIIPDTMPEGYGVRFLRTEQDYEEAIYSDHELPEEKREQALKLLRETEKALWQEADWKLRFRLKYWMCICE